MNRKTLIYFNAGLGDEIGIIDIDGTLYKKVDGKEEPMRFNTHDGGGEGPDGNILSHENLQHCGWEVGENPNRNFRSAAILPSDCFTQDIEQEDGLTENAIEAIKKWAADDLKKADAEAIETLKPMEREAIGEMFSAWLEAQEEGDEQPDEEKIQNFIDAEQEDAAFFWYGSPEGLICFHDDDEVREICREVLKK